MISWLRIFSSLSLLTLAGCAPTIHSSKLEMDAHSLNHKAIVITKGYVPNEGFFALRDKLPIANIWERLDDTKAPENHIRYNFSSAGFFIFSSPCEMQAHMVEPGTYVLNYLRYRAGEFEYTITPSEGEIFFTVKPREVIYIGTIKVNNNDRGYSLIEVKDEYDEAVRYFAKEVPKVKTPVEKRLLLIFNHISALAALQEAKRKQ